MDLIILNQIDNVLLRILMGALSSFIGGLGVLMIGSWITKKRTGFNLPQLLHQIILK